MTPAGTADFDHVAVDNVSRHFGRRRAVSRVSFTARSGAILGLLGPNGAGKSTLLAMLATLLRPTTGTISFGSLDPRVHGAGLRGRIGILGHELFLYPELTAFEILAFFAGLYRQLGLPVIPIALDSGFVSPRRSFLKRPGTVTVLIGDPIPPKLPREEVEARVHEAINALERNPAAR